jgi:threonine aldolase
VTLVDLRSDTVTRPTPAMREAMVRADVGDDVYGEDPTVRALEERVADELGKEAALFVPTGTMGNQLALLCHCKRGDEVVVGEGAHVAFYESGAGAAWAGVQFAFAGQGGLFTAEALDELIRPRAYYLPRTSLVSVENTHNRAGGRVFPLHDLVAIAARARTDELAVHMDGARLWNASVATGLGVRELSAPCDSVSVCFSKGLGAPVGSALAGSRDFVVAAHRYRKMMGGGMRQVGVLAAAALYALEHHRGLLELDHARARRVASVLREVDLPGVRVGEVETNIVQVELPFDASRWVDAARARGVLIGASDRRRVRIVTHLDVSDLDAERAALALRHTLCELASAHQASACEPGAPA